MKRLLLWSVLAALALGGLAGISQAVPEWTEDSGIDFWNLPRLNRQLESQARRSEELDARFESTLSRIEMRQQVVNQLVAGHLSLREAAAKFREINQSVRQNAELVEAMYPNMGEDERYCRYVLDYVRGSMGYGNTRTAVMMRLEQEFEYSQH